MNPTKSWLLNLSFGSAVFLSLVGAGSALADAPVLVPSPVEKAFVPHGFDDNDDIELVVHGHYPDTCYKTGPATATVDQDTHTISIEAQSYFYRGDLCATVMVPFIQSVKVGMLPIGTYTVVVKDRPDVVAPDLIVGRARSTNPDDNLYAPVASAWLDKGADGAYSVRLEGEYPFMFIGCMLIREVRTYMSPGNTLVVLPIAELTDGPECDDHARSMRFQVTQAVGTLREGDYLIHVRALDGNSVNRFTQISR